MDNPQTRDLNITQVPTKGFEKAPFLIRFVATLLDGIILGIACMIVKMLLMLVFHLVNMPLGATIGGWIVQLVASYFYYGKFYSQRGASPGKQLFNLRVENAETGQNVTEWNAFFRETIGKFVSAIILMIGYLMALFREDGRALHDLMFNTRVVRIKK